MSDYKPVFTFQSQVNSQDKTVENTPQTVTQQADQSNTLGSVSTGLGVPVVNSLELDPYWQKTASALTGGLVSQLSLGSDPTLQCSIIKMASALNCNRVPACAPPKTILRVKNDDGKIELDCGCVDEDSKDYQGPSIDDLVDAAPDCMRNIRNQAWNDCVGDLAAALNALKFRNGVAMPWGTAIDFAIRRIEEINNDSYLSPNEKAQRIQQILIGLAFNMQELNNGFLSATFVSRINSLASKVWACADRISNDCSLIVVPDEYSIEIVVQTMSTKKEKTCGSYPTSTGPDRVTKSGKRLNDQCECECSYGSGVPCPDTDYCIDCSQMGGYVKYNPAVPGPYGVTLTPASCECKCPEGQRQYTLSTGKMSVCLPECPKGQSFIEMSCDESVVTWVDPETNACYGCACVKSGGSFPWSKPIQVTNEYCDSIIKNAVVDANNNCECACPDGWKKYTNPYGDGASLFPNGKCLPPCPEGTQRNFITEKCECYNGLTGQFEPPRCEGDDAVSDPVDPCSCICVDSKKQYNKYTDRCECKGTLKELPFGSCEPGTSSSLTEDCECICPAGTCKNGSVALPKRNPDRCDCICVNSCPEGTTQTANCECVSSGAVGVSFTTNVPEIMFKLGYSIVEEI